jgi:acyl-CoA synthetase (AMP-forming)/AMP-acid ligase II
MPAVIHQAAARFGDDDFVVMLDRRISFRAADVASRHIAKQLLATGVGKGTHVGIHLATGPEWAVAFLAVARVGAIAMPFSTIYRPAELRTAMRVGDVAVLVSSPTMLGKDHERYLEDAVPGLDACVAGRVRSPELPYLRTVLLAGASDRRWASPLDIALDVPDSAADTAIDGFDDAMLAAIEREVTPADPLVAVFTSGTTADPKAVLHTHGAVVRKTAPSANASLNTNFVGRDLTLMPFFWVGGMQQVIGALQSGATVLTLERLEAKAALELATREQATSVAGNQVLRSLFGGADLVELIPSLRPLPQRPWEGGPSSRGHMATGIGMTETFGPWANVGGMTVRVVDTETGEDVPEGEIGEFLVRGFSLMLGLCKREREDVFTPDGFYPTGDLGYVEGGKYYFSARLKDMIKTKGANVAPAEVEAVLNANPSVRLSIVLGLPHPVFGEEVVAAVVPEAGSTIVVDELLAECRRTLSSYKVPHRIEALRDDEVPLLLSGKPDRRAVSGLVAGRHSS